MQTVFSHIIQKRYSQSYEDIATDALAYILNTHQSAHQGMIKILRSVIPNLPDLLFNTQRSEGNIRPDMRGYFGVGTYLFVENKFWAGLTESQPISYLEELAKYPNESLLLFIVPGAREQTMIAELIRRIIAADHTCNKEYKPTNPLIWCIKTSLGPFLAVTSWPRIINFFIQESKNDQALQSDLSMLESLCDAADIGKFLPIDSNELNNQLIPTLILQLGQIIRDSVQLGLRYQIISNQGLTESVRWDKFGKYIWLNEVDCVGVWFGLDHQLWKTYGVSPLWMKFSTTNFGRANEVRPLLMNSIDDRHLLLTLDDGSLVYSINITTNVDKDQIIEDIVDQIRELADLVSVLITKN